MGFKGIKMLICMLSALWLVSSAMFVGAATIELDAHTGRLTLSKGLLFYEDADRALSIDQAHALAERGSFKVWHKNTLNFGYSPSTYWIRIDLANDFSHDQQFFLEQDYSSVDHVDFYQLIKGGRFDLQVNGDRVPFSARSFKYHNHVFSFTVAKGDHQVIYLKLSSNGILKTPLALYSADAFTAKVNLEMILFGLLYGVLSVMAVYNFFLFMFIRDKVYFYYVVYVIMAILTVSAWDGLAAEYLWPNSPWWADRAVLLFIGLVNFSTHLFAQAMLNTKVKMPVVHLLLQAIKVMSLVQVVLALGPNYTLAGQFSLVLTLLSSVVGISAGIVGSLKGLRSARLYLVGWSLYFIGVILLALTNLGLFPHHWFTQHIMHLGWIFEITLFSVALAARINSLSEQRQQAEQARMLAEAETDSKGRLLADISHEIRTPLHGIMGTAEVLLCSEQTPEQQAYCEQILQSSGLLSELVNSTLDYARLDDAGFVPQVENFSVIQLLKDIRLLLKPLAQQKSLTFTVFVDDSIPVYLKGDYKHIRQVLINLVGNAIKYTQRGSVTVSITIEHRSVEGICLRFNVEDTGIGVLQEKTDELFLPYVRKDHEGTAGTGLGLTICKQLVNGLGGEIGVQSKPGRGSSFWFTLLMEEGGEPLGQVSNTEFCGDESALLGLSILVVDDLQLNRNIALELLCQDQHQVTLADTAAQALREIKSQNFDVILMDIFLPDIDGIELTQMIRQQALVSDSTPIIALTASVQPDSVAKYLAAGMQHVIAKPVRLATLRRTLHQALTQVDDLCSLSNHMPYKTEQPDHLPLLDLEQVDVMCNSMPIEQLSGLVTMGKEGCEDIFTNLHKTVVDSDDPEYQKLAHQLGSTSRQLGLSRLAAWAWKMESKGFKSLQQSHVQPQILSLEELQSLINDSFKALADVLERAESV